MLIGERSTRRRRERELPAVAAALGRSVRSGSTLVTAFDDLSRSVPSPLDRELADVVRLVGRGRPLDEAMDRWVESTGSESVALLAAGCRFGLRDGGDLAAVLDGVAITLLDRIDTEDEARALTSQARASAAMLIALPLFGAAAFCLLDPRVATTLFSTGPGRLCIVVAVLLDGAAALVMARMVRAAVS